MDFRLIWNSPKTSRELTFTGRVKILLRAGAGERRLLLIGGNSLTTAKGYSKKRNMKIRVQIPLPGSNIQDAYDQLSKVDGRLNRTEAAEIAHLSEGQFSRQFKKAIGVRFRDAQLTEKLRRGAQMLVSTNLKIGEIAEILGYSEPSKFRQAFFRKYSLTPTEYRNLATLRNVV